jgi:hypothetical protein
MSVEQGPAKELRDRIVALWSEGAKAPYDLYEAEQPGAGMILVESSSDRPTPLVKAGELVSGEIAARVRAQIYPPVADPVNLEVPKLDAAGKVIVGADGGVETMLVTVDVEPEVFLLSDHSRFEYDEAADNCCDQCGLPRAQLFRIGSGFFCKELRRPSGATSDITCFDLRLRQLGADL